MKRNKKIQWLSGEVNKLSFENEHMTEIELKNKEKFELKISELNDEIRKLTKISHRLPQLLNDAIEKKNDMEENIIPDLNYKIEKLASILKYQTRKALLDKQKTKNLQIHALDAEFSKFFKDNLNND